MNRGALRATVHGIAKSLTQLKELCTMHLDSKQLKLHQIPLVVQWLSICLLMQGTWVPSLVREGSTCCGASKPM